MDVSCNFVCPSVCSKCVHLYSYVMYSSSYAILLSDDTFIIIRMKDYKNYCCIPSVVQLNMLNAERYTSHFY